MRVLRIYPGGNDGRHRQRDVALTRLGLDVGLVLPTAYAHDWCVTPVEPELRSWRATLYNSHSIPLHLWRHSVLARAIREFDPDLVDIHEEPFFPSGAQGMFVAGGRPTVMYSAQNLVKRLAAPVAAMQRWVLRRVGGMYPCSEGAAAVLGRRGYAGPLRVVPLGVDEALFQVRPTGERIGFVGRLVPEKGVEDLFSFGPRLLCVGDGPLRDAAAAAGCEIRRAQDVDQLCEAYAEMAVLAVPSRTTARWMEQFGRTAAEAMAAGVPVVAYASGALPEVISAAGVLVTEGDVKGLQDAIRGALARHGDFASRGRERARACFTWKAVAGQMLELYLEALRGRGVNPAA